MLIALYNSTRIKLTYIPQFVKTFAATRVAMERLQVASCWGVGAVGGDGVKHGELHGWVRQQYAVLYAWIYRITVGTTNNSKALHCCSGWAAFTRKNYMLPLVACELPVFIPLFKKKQEKCLYLRV